jgi:hypothetical protein
MDRDDRVLAIVLAAEHLLRFARVHFASEIVESRRELCADRFPRLCPLGEHREVVDAALQRFAQRLVVFEPPAALQQLLCSRLVLPEVGVGDTLLDFRQFFCGAGGVKDSSADRPRAWRGPDTDGAARRVAG